MATNVQFYIVDFGLDTKWARVTLIPNESPVAYGMNWVGGDPITKCSDQGTILFSDCVPGIYSVEIVTDHSAYNPRSCILIPETSGSTVNANTIIIDQATVIPPSTFNVISSSYAKNADTASLLIGSISTAISSSYAATASLLLGFTLSASYANTASYALNGGGSGTSLTTGSTYPITSSWSANAKTASIATSASYAPLQVSASFANSASVATAIYYPNNPNAYLSTAGGNIEIQDANSSNTITMDTNGLHLTDGDGSSILMNNAGNINIISSPGGNGFLINGNTNVITANGTFNATGSIYGTASWANNVISSSHATTASVAISASFLVGTTLSSSHANTASISYAIKSTVNQFANISIAPNGDITMLDGDVENQMTLNSNGIQIEDFNGSQIYLDGLSNINLLSNVNDIGIVIDGNGNQIINTAATSIFSGDVTVNGSLNATASYAKHATSSSYAPVQVSASYATNAGTATNATNATSASVAANLIQPGNVANSVLLNAGTVQIQDGIAGNIIQMDGSRLQLVDGAGSALTFDENGNVSLNSAFSGNGIYISGSANTIYVSGNMLASGSLYGTASFAAGVNVPTWSALTYSSTSSWAATPNVLEDRKTLILTGNTALSMSGLYNGWSGLLRTVQTGSAIYSLYLPSGTKVMNGGSGIVSLTTGSNATDLIGFSYDGTHLYAAIGNNFN